MSGEEFSRPTSTTKKQTCFISYARSDDDFSSKLHKDLEENGVECWKDDEDMRGGDFYRQQILKAIEKSDRVLLICSQQSLERPSVTEEILYAKELEDNSTANKLFPIRIDDAITSEDIKAYARQQTATGVWPANWLPKILAYHIPDFSGWEDPAVYQKAFTKLLRDLSA